MKVFTGDQTPVGWHEITGIHKSYVETWALDPSAMGIETEYGVILWHTTDFDPEGTCNTRAFVDFIFVKASHRNQGHGTFLLNEVKKRCNPDQGLAAAMKNDSAESFFHANGFRRFKDYKSPEMCVVVFDVINE